MKFTRPSDRYSQDESGKWWYRPPGHPRKGCPVRVCPSCIEEYVSPDARQNFCGHACAGAYRHAGKKPTTKKTDAPGPQLKNSDNPRYRQDAAGQWWYYPGGPKNHGRTRAHVGVCDRCGQKYVSSIFHLRDKKHCSRSCGLKAANEADPGHFLGGKPGTNWKGGRLKVRGYVLVHNPKAAQRLRPGTKKPYVLEHRLVMAEILGRDLLRTEQVHHKNGVRDDNRPENLELWSKQQPSGQRSKEQKHCPTCTCNSS